MAGDAFVTWNLLLCSVAFPALGWFIRREIANIHEGSKERQKELKEEIQLLRNCIGNIKKDVGEKVDKNDCNEMSEEKWNRIYHHRHTESGEVVVTK